MLNEQKWPEYDEEKCKDDSVEIPVQVNGKLKGTITIPVGAEKEQVQAMAQSLDKVASAIAGKNIIKVIYIQNKLINIVAK